MDARSPDADVAVSHHWRPDKCDRIALVLQGGGALGAYQVGVYQALHEAGLEPDWVIGTSIGAINGALIAGNREDRRLARLDEFWDKLRLSPMLEPMAAPWARHWYANFM